jgi:HK97 family phage portal protein
VKSVIGGALRAARRSTLRNQAPVPLASRYTGALSTLLTSRSELSAMSAVGTIFAIVNGLAEATSTVRWGLYRSSLTGNPEDRKPILKHAALNTWNRPNDFMSGVEFRHAMLQHYELVGETDWLVGRDPRFPTLPLELWPVRPDRLQPIPDAKKFLAGWEYLPPDGGQPIPLPVSDVIQMKLPNPEDPYRGMGPVQSVLQDIDSARYSAEWNRRFFMNSAEPGGVIEVPERLQDDEWQEMNQRWADTHKGVNNAHRVAIIEKGKWVPTTFSMKDMQFQELRGVNRDVIREAWRYPVPLLGTTNDVNRATADAMTYLLARWMVVPRLERIRDVANMRFLPLFGATAQNIELDFDSPVEEDEAAKNAERDSKANAFKVLVEAGVDPRDAAEVACLPPMRMIEVKPAPAPVVEPAPAPEPAPIEPAPASRLPRMHIGDDVTMLPMVLLPVANKADAGETAFNSSLAGLVGNWSDITDAQREELRDQVAAAVDQNQLPALAGLNVTSGAGEKVLEAAMVALFDTMAGLTVKDAAAAGVTIDPAESDGWGIGDVASLVVALMASGYADAAAREALRVYRPGRTGSDVADDVDNHLASLKDAYLAQRLGAALWRAAAGGWAATVEKAQQELDVQPSYRIDESLDTNTCKPCRDINSRVYESLDDVRTQGYVTGGYVHCQGGDRCRGRVKVVWQ